MALNQLWEIWSSSSSTSDLEQRLLLFHAQNNQHVVSHWLAHASLFGCACKQRQVKKMLTQGWLWTAVIPVHTRNNLFRWRK